LVEGGLPPEPSTFGECPLFTSFLKIGSPAIRRVCRMREELAAALAHHRAGRLTEAEHLYRSLLGRQPRQPDILHLLGGVAYQNGDVETALTHFDAALAAGGGAGVDSLHFNRGNALKALGRNDEAILAFIAAGEANHSNSAAFYNLGLLQQERGRFEEALVAYRMVLAELPEHAPSWNNLGVLLHEQGHLAEAEQALRLAIQHQPGFPDALRNLGRLLCELGRADDAVAVIEPSLTGTPADAALLRRMGECRHRAGQVEEAAGLFQRAAALAAAAPVGEGGAAARAIDGASSQLDLGTALSDLDRVEDAEAAFRKAAALATGHDTALAAAAWRGLGILLQRIGRGEEALAALGEALGQEPDNADGLLAACVAQVPAVPENAEAAEQGRRAYGRGLDRLIGRYSNSGPAVCAAAASAIGSVQPFYLAYQGENDCSLQRAYGGLAARLMAAAHPRFAEPVPRRPVGTRRLRVGIISGYFSWHSVWTIPIQGWVETFDRRRFELRCYHTRAGTDAATAAARDATDGFVQGPLPFEEWCRILRDDRLDAVIFPEIGMDPVSARLAALRFAPLQAASLGHPQTTGLPTIDHFFSSALMEPEDAGSHYTEQLVRLPNLGVHYTPPCPDKPPLDREELGLPEDAKVYWCCQSLFKYAPRYDEVFVRIARELPDCLFAFIEAPYPAMTATFRGRLERVFQAAGLEAERYCRFLPRMPLGTFAAAASLCDVALDSIGWSGFNTTLESVHWGVVPVTLPGRLMRGRHTTAVLTRAGVTETIARDLDHYVALAVGLAQDSGRRTELSLALMAARDRLYRDQEAVRGLETFLAYNAGG